MSNNGWAIIKIIDIFIWVALSAVTCPVYIYPLIFMLALVSLFFPKYWMRAYFDSMHLCIILYFNLTPDRTFWYSATIAYPLVLATTNNVITKIKALNHFNLCLFISMNIFALYRLYDNDYVRNFILISTPSVVLTILILNTLIKDHVTSIDKEKEYRKINSMVSEYLITSLCSRLKTFTYRECMEIIGIKVTMPDGLVDNPMLLLYNLTLVTKILGKELTYYDEVKGLQIYIGGSKMNSVDKNILSSIGELDEEYFKIKIFGVY